MSSLVPVMVAFLEWVATSVALSWRYAVQVEYRSSRKEAMTPSLAIVLSAFATAPTTLPTEFRPLAPDALVRNFEKPGYAHKPRAVILIHGMKIFPFRPHRATVAEMHDFQQTDADMPRTLAANFDVFGFAYAQTLP